MPEYLAIGMSTDEYWHGRYGLCKAYREAWKTQQDLLHHSEWRIGLYVYEALNVVLDHALNSAASSEYPELPFTSSEEEHKQVEQLRLKRKMELMKQQLETRAVAINRRLEAERLGDRAQES